MITITNTFTRPSVAVTFYVTPADQEAEFVSKYRETGKALSTIKALSSDALVATATTKWVTSVAFNEFLADPLSDTMRASRVSYCEAHNITLGMAIAHEPSPGDETSPTTV